MKSAYELAMERLNQSTPGPKVTAEQRRQLAEIDSLYASRIAEREIALNEEIGGAEARGDLSAAEDKRQLLRQERERLRAERDAKKDAVRAGTD